MTRYSPERKEAILRKVLPLQPRSVSEVANEEDIPYNTLYTWLKTVRNNGVTISNSTSLTAEKKLAIMIETGPLTKTELVMYCRKNGFYPEQIKAWKDEFLKVAQTKKVSDKETQSDKKEIKKLKKELRRMEKALAKTAALLVLRKKLNALYDLEEDEES
jgi:transposase-like protein